MEQSIDDDVFQSLRPIFIFSGLFLCSLSQNSQWQVLIPTFSGCFPSFPDYFPSFQKISSCYNFTVLQLSRVSQDVSIFLGSQLHFKDVSCTFQGCFWFTGLVPRQAGILSLSISADIFVQYCSPYNQITFMADPITCPHRARWSITPEPYLHQHYHQRRHRRKGRGRWCPQHREGHGMRPPPHPKMACSASATGMCLSTQPERAPPWRQCSCE